MHAGVRVRPTLGGVAHRLGALRWGDESSGMTEYVPVPGAAGPTPAGQRFWRGYGYLLGGLPLCIVAFVIAVVGFAAGVGTIVVWLGLPILAGTLRASRGLAGVERRGAEWATGR